MGGFGCLPRWGKEQRMVRGWGCSSGSGREALKCPAAFSQPLGRVWPGG